MSEPKIGESYIIGTEPVERARAHEFTLPSNFDPRGMTFKGGMLEIRSIRWRGMLFDRDDTDTTSPCNVALVAPDLDDITLEAPNPFSKPRPHIVIVTFDGLRFKESTKGAETPDVCEGK